MSLPSCNVLHNADISTLGRAGAGLCAPDRRRNAGESCGWLGRGGGTLGNDKQEGCVMHQQTLPLCRKQNTQSTNQTNYVQNKVHSLQIKLLCTEISTQSTNQTNYVQNKVHSLQIKLIIYRAKQRITNQIKAHKSKQRIRNTNIKITTCNNASQL